MKAKDISGQAPGGKRIKLAEVLPLDTPFMIEIYPVYACNKMKKSFNEKL